MGTSTVSLYISMTHLQLLRLGQDLWIVKVCIYWLLKDDGGEWFITVLTGFSIDTLELMFGQSWSGEMPRFELSCTNKRTVTLFSRIDKKCENKKSCKDNSLLRAPKITPTFTVHVYCRAPLTPWLSKEWRQRVIRDVTKRFPSKKSFCQRRLELVYWYGLRRISNPTFV